jgi:hypothetical protein
MATPPSSTGSPHEALAALALCDAQLRVRSAVYPLQQALLRLDEAGRADLRERSHRLDAFIEGGLPLTEAELAALGGAHRALTPVSYVEYVAGEDDTVRVFDAAKTDTHRGLSLFLVASDNPDVKAAVHAYAKAKLRVKPRDGCVVLDPAAIAGAGFGVRVDHVFEGLQADLRTTSLPPTSSGSPAGVSATGASGGDVGGSAGSSGGVSLVPDAPRRMPPWPCVYHATLVFLGSDGEASRSAFAVNRDAFKLVAYAPLCSLAAVAAPLRLDGGGGLGACGVWGTDGLPPPALLTGCAPPPAHLRAPVAVAARPAASEGRGPPFALPPPAVPLPLRPSLAGAVTSWLAPVTVAASAGLSPAAASSRAGGGLSPPLNGTTTVFAAVRRLPTSAATPSTVTPPTPSPTPLAAASPPRHRRRGGSPFSLPPAAQI